MKGVNGMIVQIGGRTVGPEHPTYVVAEIGANHNGNVDLALDMVQAAADAGADAVKFQKRTLELAIPEAQRNVIRHDTPWGPLPYIDYRRRLEFEQREFNQIATYCQRHRITWFASVWDVPSLEFLLQYDMPAIKIPSACLTDDTLLDAAASRGVPIILSTGMSNTAQIRNAVNIIMDKDSAGQPDQQLVLLWCKSAYPSKPEALNLRAIRTLEGNYGHEAVIGYSGHEVGLWTTLMAVVLGANMVERHFTMNRAAWGTDQAASLEPKGLAKLVEQIRRWEEARGDGRIYVHDSEYEPMRKLRHNQGGLSL